MFARFILSAVIGLAGATQAYAHGDTGVVRGECRMKIDPYEMRFQGLQPDKSEERFCDDIPNTGQTIIVLDAIEPELRDMTLDMRVLRDVGQKDDKENEAANTEVYLPPRKYGSGTLNFSYDFKNKGAYIGIVTARADDGKVYRARFPFSVGETGDRELMAAGVAGAVAAAGFFLWYRKSHSGQKAAA